MKDFFDLKNTRYDLQSKQLLKLPESSTLLDMVHKLSVLKVASYGMRFQTNLKTLTILRILRNALKTGNLLPAVVNSVCSYSIL